MGIAQEGYSHRFPGCFTRPAGQAQGPSGPARLEVKLQGQAAKNSVAEVATEALLADVREPQPLRVGVGTEAAVHQLGGGSAQAGEKRGGGLSVLRVVEEDADSCR